MELFLLICLSAFYFIAPTKWLSYFNALLIFLFVLVSSAFAINTLFYKQTFTLLLPLNFWSVPVTLSMDYLSAVFVLIINITVLVSGIYSIGYMKIYTKKNRPELALHYFSFFTLYWSMIVLTMLQHTIAFIVVWEIMSLSSFFLVMFESEKAATQKAGINYFIQMHIGAVLLLIGIIILHYYTDSWSWLSLKVYFSHYSNTALFFVFFVGFGLKAGFMPLHTWLPHAHPAAPSHVSAIMSGVMIKLGVYGIFRVVFSLQQDLMTIGFMVLVISLISGISGVGVAIIQHNLKRLLAYHSIENIGIIGIGMGIGILGMATNNTTLAALGFTGSILHVLNHSLFKSLLFFGAGSIYSQTHTMNIDYLGGLIKKMPITAMLFLLASLSICGLPPFNGFVSEFIIYNGFVEGILTGTVIIKVIMIFSLLGLTTIGGLAIFCFTKAFGIVFLGNERSTYTHHATEVKWYSLFPQFITLLIILAIGLFPGLFIKPIFQTVQQNISVTSAVTFPNLSSLQSVGYAGGFFVLMATVIWLLRKLSFRTKKITTTETWGCGYAGNAPKTQYTASSYAENYAHNMDKTLNITTHYKNIKPLEVFPSKRNYKTHSESFIEIRIFNPVIQYFNKWFYKLAIIQTGQTQHYVLYPFLLLIILILLTLFNMI
jgi:formate hydrogenlyase subunit 3/multisubunit Na+/H+ antiporter MnhD subunit